MPETIWIIPEFGTFIRGCALDLRKWLNLPLCLSLEVVPASERTARRTRVLRIPSYRTIVRLDYKPTLDFYGKLHSLATSIEDYPDWATNGLSVTLRDYRSNCSVFMGFRHLSYNRDLGGPEDEEARIRNVLERAISTLQKEDYNRLGFRRRYVYEVSMKFDELVALVTDKLLAQNDQIREAICPLPTDVAYVVNFAADESATAHLRVCPARRSELEGLLEPNREDNFPVEKKSLPGDELYAECADISLYIDIDYYRERLKHEDVLAAFEAGIRFHDKLTRNLVAYLLGIKG